VLKPGAVLGLVWNIEDCKRVDTYPPSTILFTSRSTRIGVCELTQRILRRQ